MCSKISGLSTVFEDMQFIKRGTVVVLYNAFLI